MSPHHCLSTVVSRPLQYVVLPEPYLWLSYHHCLIVVTKVSRDGGGETCERLQWCDGGGETRVRDYSGATTGETGNGAVQPLFPSQYHLTAPRFISKCSPPLSLTTCLSPHPPLSTRTRHGVSRPTLTRVSWLAVVGSHFLRVSPPTVVEFISPACRVLTYSHHCFTP